MNFLKWYKHIIETGQEEPPESIWENIQDELDVDMVWNNLDKKLSGNTRKKILYRFAVAASLLFFIGLGTFMYMGLMTSSRNSQPITIASTETEEVKETDTIKILSPEKKDIVPPSIILDTQKIIVAETSSTTDLTIEQTSVDLKIGSGQEEVLNAATPLNYSPPKNDHSKEMIHFGPELAMIGEKTKNRIKFPENFYMGLSGHAANTWLLNNKTVQGLRSDELTASLPSFGYNFGIVAGKYFNNKLGIQAEIHFVSQARQNYNEYLHGQYISNNYQFNYSSFSLTGRWQFYTQKNPGHHSMILGGYTGILWNAYQHVDNVSIPIGSEYNSLDYGIVAGYEYLYPVGGNFMIGTGFQTRFGLKNIFSGNEFIPDYLNNTRNASFNFMLSVKYNLK